MSLMLHGSVIPVWWKHCVMICYCTSLPSHAFGDLRLVATNRPRWEHLHHRNQQMLLIRL